MKYIKIVVIASMLIGIGYTCNGEGNCPDICGDINLDEQHNILDIVSLANCILASDCDQYWTFQFCHRADMNDDGFFNVIDVVVLVSCILAENCPDIS